MYNNYEIKQIANRLKFLRESLDVSVEEAAKAAQVSIAVYRDAEAGKVDFTFNFLQKLAKHFGVDIIQLITGETPRLTGFQVTRKGEGKSLEREHGFEYIHRAAIFKDKSAEPFIVTAKYDPEEANKPVQVSTHDDQEFDYILKGKLRVTVDNYTTILTEGDSIYYNANLPHGMVAYDGDCEFLAVVIKNSKTLSEIKEVTAEEAEMENKEYKEIFHKFVTPTLDEKGRLVKLDFHPEDNFNFGYDVVDAIAEKTPNKTAMVWLDNDKNERIFSFRDIKEQSNKTANFFMSQGIKKGDTVMVVLKRRYQFWYTMVALHKIGAIAVPASHQLTAHDYDYRFNTAKIKASSAFFP